MPTPAPASVVTHDVPPGALVKGVPARIPELREPSRASDDADRRRSGRMTDGARHQEEADARRRAAATPSCRPRSREHLQRPARRRACSRRSPTARSTAATARTSAAPTCSCSRRHCEPINDRLMEQLIMIDAAKRASAKRITAVCPFYGYARQDRKAEGREPITARLVADMLTVAGADRVVTVDLHTGQIQGFFDFPVDHLTAVPVLAEYLATARSTARSVVVAPDAGGGKLARSLRRPPRAPTSRSSTSGGRRARTTSRSRPKSSVRSTAARACIVDDMIDTAGTVVSAANLLIDRGATEVYIAATHGLLSGPAVDRLKNAPVREVVVTNTLPIPDEKRFDSLRVLSIAPAARRGDRRRVRRRLGERALRRRQHVMRSRAPCSRRGAVGCRVLELVEVVERLDGDHDRRIDEGILRAAATRSDEACARCGTRSRDRGALAVSRARAPRHLRERRAEARARRHRYSHRRSASAQRTRQRTSVVRRDRGAVRDAVHLSAAHARRHGRPPHRVGHREGQHPRAAVHRVGRAARAPAASGPTASPPRRSRSTSTGRRSRGIPRRSTSRTAWRSRS